MTSSFFLPLSLFASELYFGWTTAVTRSMTVDLSHRDSNNTVSSALLSHFSLIALVFFTTTAKYYEYTHFTHQETEAQRTYPRPHNWCSQDSNISWVIPTCFYFVNTAFFLNGKVRAVNSWKQIERIDKNEALVPNKGWILIFPLLPKSYMTWGNLSILSVLSSVKRRK